MIRPGQLIGGSNAECDGAVVPAITHLPAIQMDDAGGRVGVNGDGSLNGGAGVPGPVKDAKGEGVMTGEVKVQRNSLRPGGGQALPGSAIDLMFPLIQTEFPVQQDLSLHL